MRVYKNRELTPNGKFDQSLVKGMSDGETIITKHDEGNELANFVVHSKTRGENFPYQGAFVNLQMAVTFAQALESSFKTYEYFVQKATPLIPGYGIDNPNIEVLGRMGWEFCAKVDDTFVYKRIDLRVDRDDSIKELETPPIAKGDGTVEGSVSIDLADVHYAPRDLTGDIEQDRTGFWFNVGLALDKGKTYICAEDNYYLIKSETQVKQIKNIKE